VADAVIHQQKLGKPLSTERADRDSGKALFISRVPKLLFLGPIATYDTLNCGEETPKKTKMFARSAFRAAQPLKMVCQSPMLKPAKLGFRPSEMQK
jgi:hypothetical protein